MANLKTDSPLTRRIVLSFIDFLNSVEPAPGVDLEGLEVAKECLADVFKIDPLIDSPSKPDSLVDIFSSREFIEQRETKADSSHDQFSADAPSTSLAPDVTDANHAATLQFQDKDWTREAHMEGISKDELFGQFFEVLEKVHYFKTMPDGNDDQIQLDRATRIFHNAIEEMEKSGCHTYDRKNLAEILKLQGVVFKFILIRVILIRQPKSLKSIRYSRLNLTIRMAFIMEFAENLILRMMEDPQERDRKFREHVYTLKDKCNKTKEMWSLPIRPYGFWTFDRHNAQIFWDAQISQVPGRRDPYDDLLQDDSTSK